MTDEWERTGEDGATRRVRFAVDDDGAVRVTREVLADLLAATGWVPVKPSAGEDAKQAVMRVMHEMRDDPDYLRRWKCEQNEGLPRWATPDKPAT